MTDGLTQQLYAESERLGFCLAGATPAVSATGTFDRLCNWLEAGYAGEMRYLTERLEAYRDPSHVLEGVRSILMLAMPYRTVAGQEVKAGEGKIASYAWGTGDYHDLIHNRLKQLRAKLLALRPNAVARGVVDTAPLLEREFAYLAGLGWIGKNTLLIHRTHGSWFFLAALLTDQTLDYNDATETDHCGSCTACLDACPTDAFPQPYVLDATKCISYLTIELRSPIPEAQRPHMDDWMFGCDICQDVCPWNRKVPTTSEATFQPLAANNPIDLIALFDLDDAAFRQRFRKTPLWRSKRRGILRNAAIVLGNQHAPAAIPALNKGLNDTDPLVREAAAWALGQYDNGSIE